MSLNFCRGATKCFSYHMWCSFGINRSLLFTKTLAILYIIERSNRYTVMELFLKWFTVWCLFFSDHASVQNSLVTVEIRHVMLSGPKILMVEQNLFCKIPFRYLLFGSSIRWCQKYLGKIFVLCYYLHNVLKLILLVPLKNVSLKCKRYY